MNRKPDWSKQAQRMYDYILEHVGVDIPQPELNAVAAYPFGTYVNSFTKRISECRNRLADIGMCLYVSRDERVGGQRRTWYRCELFELTKSNTKG